MEKTIEFKAVEHHPYIRPEIVKVHSEIYDTDDGTWAASSPASHIEFLKAKRRSWNISAYFLFVKSIVRSNAKMHREATSEHLVT